jgi:PAS domain-containing protein
MEPHPALAQFLTEFKRVASAIVDSYFVVDTERRIVDFNRAFFAMLPRQVARGLKGKHCYEVHRAQHLQEPSASPSSAGPTTSHVRLDEISGKVAGRPRGQGPALHPVGGADHRRGRQPRSARSRSSATSPTRRWCR